MSEIRPLKTLSEVLDWIPDLSLDFQLSVLLPRKKDESSPKLLVCHDMQGGYLSDRFVKGSSEADSYRFFHWDIVDIFVYFSHNFITIPPIGWINAAHKHGVKVLGTLITEWDAGFKICETLLNSPPKILKFVNNLCCITKHFGFDGWLVNIENKIEETLIPSLQNFLKLLNKASQELDPNSVIVWYDSVVHSGNLQWQNELNESNKCFFDATGGIFLNYNWTDEHLKRSLEISGKRRNDVFVGVDVFGRGCLGGGGYNTSEALQTIEGYRLSVALFAPGWVLEANGTENFTQNQYKFWNLINSFFQSAKICQLPIQTSFCQGFGHKLFNNGKIVEENPWYNLSCQELQPMWQTCREDEVGCQGVVCSEDAFNGGGCLKILGKIGSRDLQQDLKLFGTEIDLNSDLLAILTWKLLLDPGIDLSVCLYIRDPQSQEKQYLLLCHQTPDNNCARTKFISSGNTLLVNTASAETLKLCGLPVPDVSDQWTSSCFLLDRLELVNHSLTDVKIRILCVPNVDSKNPLDFSLLLGQIQILPFEKKKK